MRGNIIQLKTEPLHEANIAERDLQNHLVEAVSHKASLPIVEELYITTSATRWKYESRPDVIPRQRHQVPKLDSPEHYWGS